VEGLIVLAKQALSERLLRQRCLKLLFWPMLADVADVRFRFVLLRAVVLAYALSGQFTRSKSALFVDVRCRTLV
jgi:hypothetical protein